MAENVLTLSTTEFDRPTIAIDDVAYEMRAPEELSLKLVQKLTAVAQSLKETDDTDIDGIAEHLSQQLDLVMVDLPAEVRDRLTLGQQAQILRTFTKLARGMGVSLASEETT